jgi:hypothetical protein
MMHIGFPADRNKIIQFVQKEQESNPDADLVAEIPLFQKIEERQYEMLSKLQELQDLFSISNNNDNHLPLSHYYN